MLFTTLSHTVLLFPDGTSDDPKLAAAASPPASPECASTLYPDMDFGYHCYATGADALQTDLYTNVDHIPSAVRSDGKKGAYYSFGINRPTDTVVTMWYYVTIYEWGDTVNTSRVRELFQYLILWTSYVGSNGRTMGGWAGGLHVPDDV
ncbi:hypothetical protein N0V83_000145 [Neocucurbitaria cava]|uniref:Uncharacterized protein n=1 Tax=Neocucurbitaria cava TaxID=798079 RepID=A0A9W8YFU1_9PLEO|nr:hypothetical protein N0V83_000145 [Neocucurbitaria cava]